MGGKSLLLDYYSNANIQTINLYNYFNYNQLATVAIMMTVEVGNGQNLCGTKSNNCAKLAYLFIDLPAIVAV